MNLVILDGFTANPGDLSWKKLDKHVNVTIYDRTPASEILQRAKDADLLLTNKVLLTRTLLEQLPRLRYIGLLSTGTNAVDLAAASERGITVTNIPNYSTMSVAQMVFSHLLELSFHAQTHSEAVHRGEWTNSQDFCFWNLPLLELSGKNMGIIGYGQIGQAVAGIAEAFGMHVLACRSPARTEQQRLSPTRRLVFFHDLMRESDVISLHCPLTPETDRLIRHETLDLCKDGAILINTARGGLLDERDVAAALHSGKLSGFGADVLSTEPPTADNPLLHSPNTILTPHIAWAAKAARARLIDIAVGNVCAFLTKKAINIVNF